MRKVNKSKVIIAIIILIAVIFELVALKNSRAKKAFDITAEIVDADGKIATQEIKISATEAESNKTYITLPEMINTKNVISYEIERHDTSTSKIEANNIIDENTENVESNSIGNYSTEKNNEIVDTQEEKDESKMIDAGKTLDLTDEEIKSGKIILKTQYRAIQKGDQILYEQKLENGIDTNNDGINDNNIIIEGYMPDNSSIQAKIVEKKEIEDKLKNTLNDKTSFQEAYDIKIVYNEKEYEPTDFDLKVKVTIQGVGELDTTSQKYKLVHIDNSNKVQEITELNANKDVIEFSAKSFSTYALLVQTLDNGDTLTSIKEDTWDGTVSSGFKYGSGTSNEPYLISTGADLAYLASQVNNSNTYEGQYFRLIVNINLNGRNWTPIGTYNNSFKGNFDGQGHIIRNGNISLPSSLPTSISSYGIFGSIGGGSSYSTIKNLEIDNISINMNASGSTSTSSTQKGYNIGIVTGTMFKNASIKNIILNGNSISTNNTIQLSDYNSRMFIGGIAGYAVNSTSSTEDPGTSSRYEIENCYSNVNFNLNIEEYNYWWFGTHRDYTSVGQYAVGGIIGGIQSQPVWPKNCLYKGGINATYAFTGPIFGYLRQNTDYKNTNNFSTLWNGYDSSSSITMNSYFNSYTTNNTSFTTSVTSGTSNQRVSSSLMGEVQGVNKGIYTNSLDTMLANFNNYVTTNTGNEYLPWYLDTSTNKFYFTPVLSISVQNSGARYTINVTDKNNTGTYTYKWYKDGTLDTSLTSATETIMPDWDNNHTINVLVSNGTNYAIASFDITKLEIHIVFTYDSTNNVLTGTLAGTGLAYVNLSDYTYQWYKDNISGDEEDTIDGATTNVLTGLEKGTEYKLTATNSAHSYMSTQNTYLYGTRTVIYVNYNNGWDSYDGSTPSTALSSLSKAYSKFSSSTTRNENIIVLMGNYTDTNYINSASSTTYQKNVTITGKYKGTEYNGVLYFEGESTYRYLNGNTTFTHLTFNGNGGRVYFYLQGYSLTMDEAVTMTNYNSANTNQGLITGNAPGFHIIAGWLQYDYSTLPRNNPQILIKSGTYGRIILGGSPGTNDSSNLEKYTSKNFTGSSMSDAFNISVTIDIKNSTTSNSYTYDVNLLVGGEACGNTYANVTENIKSGKVGRVLGGSIGDTSNRPSSWNYPINTYIGTTTVNISGGNITELYGGCLGRNMSALTGESSLICDSYFYGTIGINITGGSISGNIYGAGAGGVTGYDTNSSDTYKSYGQSVATAVNISISGGNVQGNIFGGGYGYTEYLTESTTASDGGSLYGTSNIVISGSPTIGGNIFGAGCGYNLSSKPNLAQLIGNSNITINGTPSITGIIYGSGNGISGYANMAKLIGNATVNVNADLINNVYCGGNIASVTGNTNLNVNSGNHTADMFAGGNLGIINGTSNVTINGGSSSTVYCGGQKASVTTSNAYIAGGTTQTLYAGGNEAGVNTTHTYLKGGTVNTAYGGSNNSGNIESANIETTSGTATNIFGGNNAGGTCPLTSIKINGGNITDSLYGGGNKVATNNTYLYLNSSSSSISNVYGGGNQAGVTTTNIECNGANASSVFGGSNTSGNVTNSNIKTTAGKIENIYGGNNLGGSTETTTININGGTIENVFGGGNQTSTSTSNITSNSGTVNNIYGGGNQAGLTTSNVNILGGDINNAFGGSNKSGTVDKTNVLLNSNNANVPSSGVTMNVSCTASAKTWQSTTYSTIVDIKVKYINNTATEIDNWNSYIQADDSVLYTNWSSSNIIENNGKFSMDQTNRWGGINKLTANGGTYEMEFQIGTNQSVNDFKFSNGFLGTGTNGTSYSDGEFGLKIYGGNNQGGTTTQSNVNVNNGYACAIYGGNNKGGNTITSNVTVNGGAVKTLYGGNNLGGITNSANINTNGGTVTDVYGGGNQAITETPVVNINSNITNCVYGGGNAAGINTNTTLNLKNATIGGSVYGGGNQGTVTGNTKVTVKDCIIKDSVYGGGNGTSAIVFGNTNLIMEGTTNNITNSVFGGGNQAATGTTQNNNSVSTVNIVGGTIGKNVYGGANTSVVYGTANVNIGYNTVNDNTLNIGDISIGGTVFGGGEANASGSDTYDFSFISVTTGININLNSDSHTKYKIKGSIFGSGNASSTSGYSYINIKDYGSVYSPENNISIQRANLVTLDNSTIALSGTKDRTNEYSNVNYSLSRIDEIKLKNNSILYLNYGANLLKKFTSVVDINGTETKAKATIDNTTGNVTKNVDNRIYMAEGKNLNIATNENVTAYGEVSGMTFFGLFTNTMSPSTSTGLYNKEYNNGDEITNSGTFSTNSYVIAQHMANHDTTIDGFYSNYDDTDNKGHVKCKYIETTPKDDVYYMWLVGVKLDVTTYEITLTGSKYATLGTYELALTGFATPNTKYALTGFSAGLAEGISLVDQSEIKNVETNTDVANSKFGLSMKTGNSGWSANGKTNFLTANGGTYTGNNTYSSDNSTYTPTFNFCFYHSENITLEQDLGSVKVRLQVQVPIDDLNYKVTYIDINITLKTALYQDDYYEAAITPGEQFNLFTTTETNITDSSNFSTYYSLYVPNYTKSKCYEKYDTYKHVLVSRNSTNVGYAFPKDTKITMIDMITNKYYYYVVTEDDVQKGKYIYNLADFYLMGSNNSKYDEATERNKYHDTTQDLVYENFIFHIDFEKTTIPNDIINNNLLMELRDKDDQTLIGVLGIQRDSMVYSVYKGKDAKIKVSANLSDAILYRENKDNLTVTTDFEQSIVNSKTIYDTHYFDKKMGIKISIYDSNGNRLNNDSLLGVSFKLNGTTYYPRIDGTTSIKIADKVSNVLSKIIIDTSENTTLATGDYTIKIDSFGSPDGIYYGVTASDSVTVPIRIINKNYGLKVSTDDKSKIINKTTGITEFGNNALWTDINYSSGLSNPKITVSLYRRKYSDIYSQEYSLVNLADYVSTTLETTSKSNEYLVSANPQATSQFFMSLKPNLISGTYKLVYKLYDATSYIGEDYDYIIIK